MDIAERLSRSRLKLAVISLKPSPSFPTRFSAGTSMLFKVIRAVPDAWPPEVRMRYLDTPGELRGTIMRDKAFGDVRTAVVM